MFSHSPTDYCDRQMQQRLEIRHLLLVAHPQLAEVVHPRMRSLHDPASRSASGFEAFPRRAFPGHMRDITPLPHLLLRRLARIAFIHTEILRSPFRRPRTAHHDRIERLFQKLHVVPVGPGDDKRERGATAVHQQTALGAFFSPDLLGYFPLPLAPKGPCPGFRPGFATPKQSPPSRRTLPGRRATGVQRILAAATAGSTDELNWRCRSFWAEPSIGNRYAAHTRRRRKCRAAKWACGHPQGAADTSACVPLLGCAAAKAARRATKVHPRLPKIGLSPCRNHSKCQKGQQILFTDKLLINSINAVNLIDSDCGFSSLRLCVNLFGFTSVRSAFPETDAGSGVCIIACKTTYCTG